LSQSETGALCLIGAAEANQRLEGDQQERVRGPGGWAGFRLIFSTFSAPPNAKLINHFNADALDITQLAFTIDRPPSDGVQLTSDTLQSNECLGAVGSPASCIAFGPDLPTRITASGRTTVSLADFRSALGPDQKFDTRGLNKIGFEVGAGAFDFCLSDFEFLKANGEVVKANP
jgi:hypothetical protein